MLLIKRRKVGKDAVVRGASEPVAIGMQTAFLDDGLEPADCRCSHGWLSRSRDEAFPSQTTIGAIRFLQPPLPRTNARREARILAWLTYMFVR